MKFPAGGPGHRGLKPFQKYEDYHRGQNYYKKTRYKENVLAQLISYKLQNNHFTKQIPWRVFIAKRDTPVAVTLQRKSSGGIKFAIITKSITKENVPRNYFVILLQQQFLHALIYSAEILFRMHYITICIK